MANPDPIRIGSRGSRLARWQSDWVADQLRGLGHSVEIVLIETKGDVTSGSLAQMGGVGVFTKAIQRALLAHQVDIAVHSLKDLPTDPVDGLTLAAFPKREKNGDVLVSQSGERFDELHDGARIGTGSVRRAAQLLHLRPDLKVEDIRGNVETRLEKVENGIYDAIVLAEAGLLRLGLADRITQRFTFEEMLPAVGQGALGIETRANDHELQSGLQDLDDRATRAAVTAERALLRSLRAGCLAPVGSFGEASADTLELTGVVLSPDGRIRLKESTAGTTEKAEEIGFELAEKLVARGADRLIAEAR